MSAEETRGILVVFSRALSRTQFKKISITAVSLQGLNHQLVYFNSGTVNTHQTLQYYLKW